MPRLDRFKTAQDQRHGGFETALAEIRGGRKSSHWIWYIFPQLAGLGGSPAALTYGIEDRDEAIEYLRDPVLSGRLLTIAGAVAEQLRAGRSLDRLMGSHVDALKVVSSMSLFGHVARALGGYPEIVEAAEEILNAAAENGYPRCAFTEARLMPPH